MQENIGGNKVFYCKAKMLPGQDIHKPTGPTEEAQQHRRTNKESNKCKIKIPGL